MTHSSITSPPNNISNVLDNTLHHSEGTASKSHNEKNNIQSTLNTNDTKEPPLFIVNILTNILHYFPLIDGAIFLFEFYFAVAIVGLSVSMFQPQTSVILSCSISEANCLVHGHLIPIGIALMKHSLWIYIVTRWFLWRHSVRLRGRFSLTISETGLKIIAFNIFGFILMLLLQYSFGNWIYSFDNWMKYSYEKIVLFLLGSPVLEELLIRLILTMVFRRRTGDSALWTILYTNFCFSSMHLWNGISVASDIFTFIQAIIAFVIGCFYSTRYYVTGNILELIVLHMTNNLSGMFVPLDLTWNTIYPHFILPFLLTLASYLYFLWQDAQIIQQGKSKIVPMWAKSTNKSKKHR